MATDHATAPTAPPPLGTAQHLPPGGLIAIAWSSIILAGTFVAARTAIRTTTTERLGWDDYWIYFAYAILIVNAILQTFQTPDLYSLVRANSGLVPVGAEFFVHGDRYNRYEFAIIVLFWTVLWSVKASFLALYWKLFRGLGQYKNWWMGVAVFSFLAYVGCWITSVNVCHPPALYFKFGQCNGPIDRRGAMIAVSYSTVADIVSDLMIMCLPFNMLYNVRLATKQKLGLAAVFTLGLIIIIVAIVRATQISQKTFTDGVLLALWGIIESTVSVIVGCLPPFKALFHGRRGSSSDRHTGASDLLPLRPYRGAIQVKSNENIINAEARPTLLKDISNRLHQVKSFDAGHKKAPDRLQTGIKVRSDYARRKSRVMTDGVVVPFEVREWEIKKQIFESV